ncbi:TPR repeat protein [Kribbella aluminosa]|uniref:TPR repeat protein n=1 Tax=Kribbella aluminosa TaxID=416017 RepID=A0ABS4UBH8_9ACTN|nr:tetratricopeptide repeat protein [Kribbella aluminosa]MBP2348994.1 TPR repeat protein [Kribbella aluminosa]
MSDDRSGLEQSLNDAVRDITELEHQVDAGEITTQEAARLRRRYEAAVSAALSAMGEPTPEAAEQRSDASITADTVRPSRRPTFRHVLYALGLAGAVVAAFLLSGFVVSRPPGGYVTGNDILQTPGPATTPVPRPAPSRDLSKVTDKELEAVVAANPGIVAMRLGLADRYVAEKRYDLAVVHYTKALKLEPGNAEAQAHLGWLLLQVGSPRQAAQLIDRAVAADPNLVDAQWFQANVRLYGLGDAKGAVEVLDRMAARRDLTPDVRRQVQDLRKVADQRLAGQR